MRKLVKATQSDGSLSKLIHRKRSMMNFHVPIHSYICQTFSQSCFIKSHHCFSLSCVISPINNSILSISDGNFLHFIYLRGRRGTEREIRDKKDRVLLSASSLLSGHNSSWPVLRPGVGNLIQISQTSGRNPVT